MIVHNAVVYVARSEIHVSLYIFQSGVLVDKQAYLSVFRYVWFEGFLERTDAKFLVCGHCRNGKC